MSNFYGNNTHLFGCRRKRKQNYKENTWIKRIKASFLKNLRRKQLYRIFKNSIQNFQAYSTLALTLLLNSLHSALMTAVFGQVLKAWEFPQSPSSPIKTIWSIFLLSSLLWLLQSKTLFVSIRANNYLVMWKATRNACQK